jgi:hypothetical protein
MAREAATKYGRMLDQISHLTVDSAAVRDVEGVMIEHGLMTFVLDSGTVAYLKPVAGRRVGVVFRGRATVSFQPNSVTERTNLNRFYPNEAFVEEVSQIVFAVTDQTLTSQIDGFPTVKNVDGFDMIVERNWKALVLQSDEREFDDALARALLNGYAASVVWAHVQRGDDLAAYLSHDPFTTEPYRLALQKLPNRQPNLFIASQCAAQAETGAVDHSGVDDGDLVATVQHNLQIELDRSLDLVGKDRLDMTVLADSVSVIDISLYPTLTVDSIRLVGHGVVPFSRGKDCYKSWVDLPSPLKKGEKFSLEFFYHGDVFERVEDYTILQTSFLWYPAHSYRHLTFFDATFTYHEGMTLAAVGARGSVTTSDGKTTTRWTTGRQVRNYSFHIGFFKREEVPPVQGIPRAAVLYRTPDQIETVVTDMKQTLEFFTKLYGPLPIDSLIATELPGSHGEAFPGLLHLSWYAFFISGDQSTDNFFGEQFTAHEVAHQWWGIGVDFGSYRDQWLSEGFAEYSCLLYSQLAARDNERFFKLLEEYRAEIVSFGKKDIGKDLPPPAIALGRRVSQGAPRNGAYGTFVYNKGAWVLHMLRNMMLDLNTMKEDVFMTTMREFYMRHRGKRATTADFQRTIEDITGVSMQWFFDQWVYGNTIPTYTVAYASVKQADGTYKNTMRIQQSGVPETFQMYVPIKVTLDDGTSKRYRIVMKGAEATMDLPSTTSEIDDLIFNDLASVLCDVRTESY